MTDKFYNIYHENVFTPGQVVVATSVDGYYNLTEGRQYRVTNYTEPFYVDGFRFPAYVTVADDRNKGRTCHTYRFRALREGEEVTLPPT